jgi:hypothetical protein
MISGLRLSGWQSVLVDTIVFQFGVVIVVIHAAPY